VDFLVHGLEFSLYKKSDLKKALTKPSSGMSPKVCCLGRLLIAGRSLGTPHELRQLRSGSFTRLILRPGLSSWTCEMAWRCSNQLSEKHGVRRV
jgi:hypothetical protein